MAVTRKEVAVNGQKRKDCQNTKISNLKKICRAGCPATGVTPWISLLHRSKIAVILLDFLRCPKPIYLRPSSLLKNHEKWDTISDFSIISVYKQVLYIYYVPLIPLSLRCSIYRYNIQMKKEIPKSKRCDTGFL